MTESETAGAETAPDAASVDAASINYTDLAREALLEVTPESTVGAPVGTVDEGDGVVSVLFANRLPGYPGWRWTVSVAKIGDDEPTVLEVELMPGDGSLVAPEWVPWSERLAEYRAAQEHEGEDAADEDSDDEDYDDESDEDDDEDSDEDDDYDDSDDDEDDDESDDDDDDEFDADEDDLDESDDDDIEGVDVDALADVSDTDSNTDSDTDTEDEAPQPTRRRRARRVQPFEPDADLEVDQLDAGEADPGFHRA
ncbi:DUF3027 domain-containing protein [Curtobacterium flaccumfaciens]|uniref:DUF3027 domain-containing protein n=1 Tax=Curtobacterium flaccumfaciens TaxID=2035 RepID=UPI000FFF54A2|nr:DUF3027 domain-containing protein [Curtobacterium flaccumfaciens]MCS0647483.1 DUF3027 domain-containing protein [Curtobacterium flaccumfaciens pv. flaccumfaciens]MCS6525078.1 DUF3027 domain-containing protein [Curtobacterium flaccumfaciens pv. flaccumfaciens]MCS6530224.1 DUF3027 domain-containing protein [Curtobacterium flaccumfaciens pv. flaccumfaciens]NUU10170.1 DUF3027 domain-containing protein [Curtobacterium flaccumfaciens]RXF85111.1 DUF3027 domain-containing protein [Curtobacterium fl